MNAIEMEYRDFVQALFKRLSTPIESQLHAVVGICGEAGELLDNVKKSWIYNKEQDVDNVVEELGDILFYFTAMCLEHGVCLEDLMVQNMDKLKKRYPSGTYKDADAQARADKVASNETN